MGGSGEHTPKLDYEKESQNRPDFMGKLSDRELLLRHDLQAFCGICGDFCRHARVAEANEILGCRRTPSFEDFRGVFVFASILSCHHQRAENIGSVDP